MSIFVRSIKRTGAWLALLLLPLLCCHLAQVEAASQDNELKYFQAYEAEVKGKKVLRLEFGLKKDKLDYKLQDRRLMRKQLILEMNNTKRKDVEAAKLPGELVSKLKFEDNGQGGTRAVLDLTNPQDTEFNAYLLEADRKEKKPARLIVDIYDANAFYGGTVENVEGRTIVIDPGHGGTDRGASGPSGITEKEITLDVSKKVRDILTASGAKVVMTRETDKDVYGPEATDAQELQARVDVGEYTRGTDIFVSIHCNAFSNPAAHGMETYYYDGSYEGMQLATYINEELERSGGLFNRGVKTANFYVIKHSSMPATLLELAFITNYEEERLLMDEQYQQKLAHAIARGIGRFFS